ncbi:MAG: hypothetical protein AB7K09_07550 [Planctomycetota bacterium]
MRTALWLALFLLIAWPPGASRAFADDPKPAAAPADRDADYLNAPHRQMPAGVRFFMDGAYITAGRAVTFDFAPGDTDGNLEPRGAIGIGLWLGEGFGKSLGEPLSNPLGIRVGVAFGGSIGGKDVGSAQDKDFSEIAVEIELLSPWNNYGVGPQIVLGSWDMYGTVDSDQDFRGSTVANGSFIHQKIEFYGAGIPFTLFSAPLSLGKAVPTFVGVVLKYAFMQVSLEVASPSTIRGSVPSHTILGGAFVDWGVATWLRIFAQVEIGGVVGYPTDAIVNFRVSATFVHVPRWMFDGRVQILATFGLDISNLSLQSRYLHDPAASTFPGVITWTNVALRVGLRLWL